MDEEALNILKRIYVSESNAPSSKHRTLHKILLSLIEEGVFPYGSKLPSTRLLASSIGVSRVTALKSYELLKNSSHISSVMGSGYSVSYSRSKFELSQKKVGFELSNRALAFERSSGILTKVPHEAAEFYPGIPPLDLFPINTWKTLINRYWRNVKTRGLSFAPEFGLKELQSILATHLLLSKGINCHPQQIMIVSGNVQSIFLTTTLLINPGDKVALQNPSMPSSIAIFKGHDARLVELFEGTDIKLCYVNGLTQYPSQKLLSKKNKKNLLKWASECNSVIIEDDLEHVLGISENAESLFELDQDGRVIYLFSLNRILHPSIRISFMVVPEALIQPMESLISQSHQFIPPSIQSVIKDFIQESHLSKHSKIIREVKEIRYRIFKAIWQNTIPELPFDEEYSDGLYTRVLYCGHVKKWDLQAVQALAESRIYVQPLSTCYWGKKPAQGFVMSYTCIHESRIGHRIREIKKVLKDRGLL